MGIDMDIQGQARKADLLRKLHHSGRTLVLPNVWDVASARIFEEMGFPAIATTSAGIAASLGYPDGQLISRDEMLDIVGRIARAVRVPVTADLEAGYGSTPDDMTATVKAMAEAGAVGMNLEDVTGSDESTHVDLATQVEKIQAIRRAGEAIGVPLVLNARTDIYLMPIGPEATRFDRTVERLRAYRKAGADCLFVPGLKDATTIAKLVKAIDGPLNILATAGGPTINELQAMGAARVSMGSGVMRSALGHARRIGKELLDQGTFDLMLDGAVPFAELMALMSHQKN
jgi:2-methylisocitrate lyase-like PEP mutase family enzyme